MSLSILPVLVPQENNTAHYTSNICFCRFITLGYTPLYNAKRIRTAFLQSMRLIQRT